MGLVDCFKSGYQAISGQLGENDKTYEEVKKDLDKIKNWEKLDSETKDVLQSVKEFFVKFVDKDPVDEGKAIEEGKKFGKIVKEYSDRFYDLDAIIDIEPELIKAKLALLEERLKRVKKHGPRCGVAGVLLLSAIGAITAWQITGGNTDIKAVIFGATAGFGVGILVFGIGYFILIKMIEKRQENWKSLQPQISKLPDIRIDIERKRPITRDISSLLNEGVEDSVVEASRVIVEECNRYSEAAP